jgi:hypothetical protein
MKIEFYELKAMKILDEQLEKAGRNSPSISRSYRWEHLMPNALAIPVKT